MQAITGRLPLSIRARLTERSVSDAYEIRLRVGQPLELRTPQGSALFGQAVEKDELDETVLMLMDHSVYAHEEQMRQGFFPLAGGFRVGLTGGYVSNGERLTGVSSLTIRIAREIRGAADGLMPRLLLNGRPLSALILSAPMMGKTTMLRDIARQLSMRGMHVAISDERGELAGCRDGVATLDLGPMCDVCDGLPKRLAIPALIRSMAPEVLITDELGHPEDAQAVADAARCGVCVIASAHADSFAQARGRAALAPLFQDKLFRRIAVLGGKPGLLRELLDENGAPS